MRLWPGSVLAAIAVFCLYDVSYFLVYLHGQFSGTDPIFGDFFAFWSYSRFVHLFSAQEIYDVGRLQAFQQALPGGLRGVYPYAYPPMFLFYIWPLGWMPYVVSYGVWMSCSLGAFTYAVVGASWRQPGLWLGVVAPSTLFVVISGQTGLLAAAAIIGGFRVIGRRPVLGGAILGVLACKPQLAILLPVVLVAARQWKGICGLVFSVSCQLVATLILFGPGIWGRWLSSLPTQWHLLDLNSQKLSSLQPTIIAGLLEMGAGSAVAHGIQAVTAILTIWFLWSLFEQSRRRAGLIRGVDVAALSVGIFLVTPYAFVYDMPLIGFAVGATICWCQDVGRDWRFGEKTVLLAALLLPILMVAGIAQGRMIAPLVLLLLFLLVTRIARVAP